MSSSILFSDESDIVASIQEELAREVPTLSQLREELEKELVDPEISHFRNIRHLSAAEWDSFDARSGMFEIPDDTDKCPAQERGERKKKRKIHARRAYHYKIGQYESSAYYNNFLSDAIVQVAGQRQRQRVRRGSGSGSDGRCGSGRTL